MDKPASRTVGFSPRFKNSGHVITFLRHCGLQNTDHGMPFLLFPRPLKVDCLSYLFPAFVKVQWMERCPSYNIRSLTKTTSIDAKCKIRYYPFQRSVDKLYFSANRFRNHVGKPSCPGHVNDYERLFSRHRDLRCNNTLSLPKVNTTKHGLNFFRYFAAKQWNSIPNELRLKAGGLELYSRIQR